MFHTVSMIISCKAIESDLTDVKSLIVSISAGSQDKTQLRKTCLDGSKNLIILYGRNVNDIYMCINIHTQIYNI